MSTVQGRGIPSKRGVILKYKTSEDMRVSVEIAIFGDIHKNSKRQPLRQSFLLFLFLLFLCT